MNPTLDELEDARAGGLKAAALILLITAGFGFFAWALSGIGHPVSALVDVTLGGLLLARYDFLKPVVLARATIGFFSGVVVSLGGFNGSSTLAFALVVGSGQILYCLSLFLLLFGVVTAARVRVGVALFAISILMTAASIVVIETGPAPLR